MLLIVDRQHGRSRAAWLLDGARILAVEAMTGDTIERDGGDIALLLLRGGISIPLTLPEVADVGKGPGPNFIGERHAGRQVTGMIELQSAGIAALFAENAEFRMAGSGELRDSFLGFVVRGPPRCGARSA